MLRPHDTDRILAVLGEAIEALRRYANDHEYEDPSYDVANDLALLHGAVSAEAQRHDERETLFVNRVRNRRLVRQPVSNLYRHREEIELEVQRGEHRETD